MMKAFFWALAGVAGLVSGNTFAAESLGRLEGRIRYVSNPDQPWRYARYYVPGGKEGPLAEAVVVLQTPKDQQVAAPATIEPSTHVVDQVNFMFVPETLAIRVGDTVRFSNSDDALHNVMTTAGRPAFNINLAKGQKLDRVFDVAGGLENPVRLGCVFHGGMRGWVFVFDHPWYAITAKDGKFAWKDLPPGDYEIRAFHPAGRMEGEGRVTVKAGETVPIELTLTPN